MNCSGIIRRVDELGRIVIPVEIRKILCIKEGENLEFNIQNNEIILKKKSLMVNGISILNDIDRTIADIIDGNYIITDREKVIFSSISSLIGNYNDELLLNNLNTHEEYMSFNQESLFNNQVKNKQIYVFPYSVENTIAGFIILYDINDVNKYTKLLKFIVSYINNKLSIK